MKTQAFEGWQRGFRKKKDISESICRSLGSHPPRQWCLIKMLASFSLKVNPELLCSFRWTSWLMSPRSVQQPRAASSFSLSPRLRSSTKWEMKRGKRHKERWQIRQASIRSWPARWAERGPQLSWTSKPNDGQTSERWIVHGPARGITHSMNNQASTEHPAN